MEPNGFDNPLSPPPQPEPSPLQPEYPAPPTTPVEQLPPSPEHLPGQITNQLPGPPAHFIQAFERTAQTVAEIEKNLGTPGPQELDDHVRQEIFEALDELRKKDSQFAQDLVFINAQLQRDGYLPNLFISDIQPGEQVKPNTLIGPNSKDGFHLDKTMAPPTPTGGEIDFSPPPHAALPPDQGQSDWHEDNPGNPVGSTGAESNIGGSTPIGDTDIESNPVQGGELCSPELMTQIKQALELLNAQRAAQGLPPIESTPENMKAILQIIQHESGGNPNAQNNDDSNAANGDPSRGLMQTIGGTFSSYHVQGTSNNIFDPVANIAAGVNYAVNRYGSLQEVPGVKATASGGSYVGY
jgi:hypothetical protein